MNDKRVRRLWRDEGPEGALPSDARSASPGSAPTSARCARSPRTPCGRSTSSSTSPSTAARSRCSTSSTSSPASASPSSSIAPSTPMTSSPSSTASPLERGAPAFVRFDNGPEFIAHAVADWCRFNGVATRVHRPRLAVAERLDRVVQRPPPRRAAQRLAVRQPPRSPRDHRGLAHRLQQHRPHTAHGDLTPTEFAQAWTTNTNPKPHSTWTTHRGPLTR